MDKMIHTALNTLKLAANKPSIKHVKFEWTPQRLKYKFTSGFLHQVNQYHAEYSRYMMEQMVFK